MITTKGTIAFDLFIEAIKKTDGHLGWVRAYVQIRIQIAPSPYLTYS